MTADEDAWTQRLGPLLDARQVAQILDIPKATEHPDLLSLQLSDGRWIYPECQFHEGRPTFGLGEVLRLLPEAMVSPWTVASWLVSPEPDLGGESPLVCLQRGGFPPVAAAAARWAAQLA